VGRSEGDSSCLLLCATNVIVPAISLVNVLKKVVAEAVVTEVAVDAIVTGIVVPTRTPLVETQLVTSADVADTCNVIAQMLQTVIVRNHYATIVARLDTFHVTAQRVAAVVVAVDTVVAAAAVVVVVAGILLATAAENQDISLESAHPRRIKLIKSKLFVSLHAKLE